MELADPKFRFCVFRGANFEATDSRDFHVATRNKGTPESVFRYVGLRLVADVEPP